MSEAAPPTPGGSTPADFGRVDADGTVYVRTADGERSVGQVPDASPEEALAFFVQRYGSLRVEVDLLAKRIEAKAVSPDDAMRAIGKIRADLAEARAVGDLDALAARLTALEPQIADQRTARREERAHQAEKTKQAKERMVAEGERLAAGTDWRGGVNRFRALLDEWKALPRLDRATDDALWHRFSSARTTYTKRRKSQFAQQAEQRDQARTAKERIIVEAEGLAGSTDWGPTTGAFRELMRRWKEAGPAPRNVEDKLWRRFRGLQDEFFAARQAVQERQDAEFQENADAKLALLAEWEPRIAPQKSLGEAKAAYRELLERWSGIGKVPRPQMRPLDTRIRKLEQAIKSAEDEQWHKSNPEARARAEDTAAKLRDQIAACEQDAETADGRGDARAANRAREAAETYRSWLDRAEAAASDFGA